MRIWSWVLKVLGWLVALFGLTMILVAFVPDTSEEPMTTGDRVAAGIGGLVIVVVCIGGYSLAVRNRLVAGRNRCKQVCADLDAQLERRRELARTLMAMTEQFATQHGGDFAGAAASLGVSAQSREADRGRESKTHLLPAFLVAAQAYPELASDRPFSIMIDQLREAEDKVAAARVEYGKSVLEHNTRIGSFPGSVPARMFRFSELESL
jgi:hypothetical protein